MKSYSAQILRSVRKSLNVNQIEMSQRLNLSQGAISKIENGILEFHALEWINFCSQFSIDPNILTLGIVTFLPNVVHTETKRDFRTGLFKLPLKYGRGELIKLHSLFPIINLINANESQFEKFRNEVKESLKVDPDFFLVLDHSANYELINDFFELKSVKAIKANFAKQENFEFFRTKRGLKLTLDKLSGSNFEESINLYIKNFASPLFVNSEYKVNSSKKIIQIKPRNEDSEGNRYHRYQVNLMADYIKLVEGAKNVKITSLDEGFQLNYA